MFGSKAQKRIANEFKDMSQDTQAEIDSIKSQNPFESAAAKSAMAKTSQNAKQFYTRSMNAMGANASPEAIASAQGKATEAIGGAAGSIAVGAEANQNNQTAALRGIQQQQMGAYGSIKSQGLQSGWDNLFKAVQPVGDLIQGVGEAKEQVASAAALASDRRLKENIHFLGILQDQRIYKFNYIGMTQVHIGVMAQDIEDKHPDCIVPTNGFKFVNYDKLFKEEA